MTPLKLAFMGTSTFAVPTLRALAESRHDLAVVYTRPPQRAGRGRKLRPGPVADAATELGIPVRNPARLGEAGEAETFAGFGLDVAVVAAYGLMLPPVLLAAPRLGCMNVHASLLPRWRGAAPVERAIEAGDAESGVSIILMEETLDTGPVLASESTPIALDMTAGALDERLAEMGAGLLVSCLEEYAAGRLTPVPQDDAAATYAPKIQKTEERIDWRRPAVELDRAIRSLSPRRGAWLEYDGRRIRVLGCRPETSTGAPGELLDDALLVACGDGALRLTTLQLSGRAVLEADTFLRGLPVPQGARFM